MIIQVKVKPNSKRDLGLTQQEDGSWLAKLKSPPVEGKANMELLRLLADHFGVAKTAISIRSGAGSKLKLIQIDLDQ